MAQHLKLVRDTKKSGEGVIAAFRTFVKETDPELSQFQAYLREGETMPDVLFFLEIMVRGLEERLGNMITAEEAVVNKLDGTTAIRTERGLADKHLASTYRYARDFYISLYGEEFAYAVMGFERRVAEDPNSLQLQALRVVNNRRDPEKSFPNPPAGVSVDHEIYIGALESALARLNSAWDGIQRADKEVKACRSKRDEVVDAYKPYFLMTARCLEAFFTLMGKHRLAKHVRPSAKRPGIRIIDLDSDETSDEGTDLTPTDGPSAGDTPLTSVTP